MLRPFARDGDRAGLRKHSMPEEQERARDAYARLTVAADAFPGFTSVELYRAMAALAACDVEEARVALARAEVGGRTRGTSLVGIELAIRAGEPPERSAAAAAVERLRTQAATRDDPWVRAIVQHADARCEAR